MFNTDQKKHKVWVEKYRPTTIGEYVFRDEQHRRQVEQWIKDGDIHGHLLLSGPPGVGKTSLINLLINELKIDHGDICDINASKDNSVEVIRNKVINFVSTVPNGEYKVVILEEADRISPNGQDALKRTMEEYSMHCRFFITTNSPNKIIPALHSRVQNFHLEKVDEDDFKVRLAEILAAEEVEFDLERLDIYVAAFYPDLRKCINELQKNTQTNGDGSLELSLPKEEDKHDLNYMIRVVEAFKNGNISAGREILCKEAVADDFEQIYTFLYRNLEFWGKSEEQQNCALKIIRNGMVNHVVSADPEINLSATLVELEEVFRGAHRDILTVDLKELRDLIIAMLAKE